MPSRCHFQSWLVRTSLIAPFHHCRTLTIVAGAGYGEHVNLGGLTVNLGDYDRLHWAHLTDFEKYHEPDHYLQRKFAAMISVEYMRRSILSLPRFAREQLPHVLNNKKVEGNTREPEGAQQRWYQSTAGISGPRDDTAAFYSPKLHRRISRLSITPSGIVKRHHIKQVCKREERKK